MHELNIVLLTVGGLVLGLGLFSGLINRRAFFSAPLIALLVGIVLGPTVLGLLDPARWGRREVILEEAARLTLAIGLMGVALRLPRGYPLKHWRSLAVLLGLVMPLMWLSGGLLVYGFLGLPLGVALLVGAVITPTDPIVSTAIVTGKTAEDNLPDHLRHVISAESGMNDGMAYPIVLLPILLLTRPPEEALPHWLTHVLLREVGGGVLFGALLGYGAGWLLTWGEKKRTIEKTSFLAYSVALSLLTLGAGKLIGISDILAVFIAGIAFDLVVGGSERAEEEGVQEAVSQFFTLPIFTLLGLAIPWERWLALGWRGLALVIAILLLRRLPAVLALRPWVGQLRGVPDALFAGWFGPVGIAALFYASLALHQTGREEAWVVGSLVICASVFAHGVTATAFTKLYGSRTRQAET